jgi:hypothetical protein
VGDKRLDHCPFGLVCGSDGKKFKTRSGDVTRLVDLLDEAVARMQATMKASAPFVPYFLMHPLNSRCCVPHAPHPARSASSSPPHSLRPLSPLLPLGTHSLPPTTLGFPSLVDPPISSSPPPPRSVGTPTSPAASFHRTRCRGWRRRRG